MAYVIDYTDEAIADLIRLRDSEPKAYAKAQTMIEELKEHPKTGTGKPEQLKGDRTAAVDVQSWLCRLPVEPASVQRVPRASLIVHFLR